MAEYLYEYLKFASLVSVKTRPDQPPSVTGSLGNLGADLTFETLLKIKKTNVEKVTGLELIPTYSFARLYKTGNELQKHKDRPACEISVTIKLGDTKNFNWPIYINGTSVTLDDGDAVIYKGCEVEHWREKHTVPNYFLGQVFLHYVDKNGPYENYKYDQFYQKEEFFIKDITKETT
jgi:hypothetical protein